MGEKPGKEMMRLNSIFSEIDAAYHEAAVRLDLSDSVMIVLYTLAANGGVCSVSDIRETGISKQTLNSALRKLEKDGAITLEAAGGLKKNIRLTDAGRTLADNTVTRLFRAENAICASWDKRDMKRFIELNEKFLRDLKEKIKEI